ncbi:hypothetical protein ACFVJW_19500 [Streptomyces libani]|uniref:hypothetical protein n=1 Tax=Streptomyces nigrescens TaxID=1920 RepID=UPI00362A4EF6
MGGAVEVDLHRAFEDIDELIGVVVDVRRDVDVELVLQDGEPAPGVGGAGLDVASGRQRDAPRPPFAGL